MTLWKAYRCLTRIAGATHAQAAKIGGMPVFYATEGSRALIDKGFTDLGVDRITANTMTVNSGPGT